jgi:hypothetical protein
MWIESGDVVRNYGHIERRCGSFILAYDVQESYLARDVV